MFLPAAKIISKRILHSIAVCGIVVLLSSITVSIAYSQDDNEPEREAVEFFNKGQDAHEKGDLVTALEYYDKALKLIPEFPEAELQRGKAYVSLGKLSEAEAAFRKATELREDWSLAFANLGAVLIQLNKFDEATTSLRKAIELDADNTPAWVARAELAIKTKAPEAELRKIYEKVASMSAAARPIATVWAARASLEYALNEKTAATRSASKALELDPKNISMHVLLAQAAIESKDPVKTNEFIKKIEMLEPAAVELPVLKVRQLIAEGKAGDALKFIDAVSNPSKELIALRGQIAASTTTDIPALEKQLETEPRNIAALSRLCSLLRISEPLRSMEFCRRAADVEPNNIDHAIGFGAAMLQAKQYAQAAALFQKLLNASPENLTLRANFATALFQLKRYNDAKVHFIWLTEKQPSNSIPYYFLAIVHDELGEYPDAMANYQLFMKFADPKVNQLEIDKVNLRLPTLQKQIDSGKGKKNAKGKASS